MSVPVIAPVAPDAPRHPYFGVNQQPVPELVYSPPAPDQHIVPLYLQADGQPAYRQPNDADMGVNPWDVPEPASGDEGTAEAALAERVGNDPARLDRIHELAAAYRNEWASEDSQTQAAAIGVARVIAGSENQFGLAEPSAESTPDPAAVFETEPIPTQPVAEIDAPSVASAETVAPETVATPEVAPVATSNEISPEAVAPEVTDWSTEPTQNLKTAVAALSARNARLEASTGIDPEAEVADAPPADELSFIDDLFRKGDDVAERGGPSVRLKLAAVAAGALVLGLSAYQLWDKITHAIPNINIGGPHN